MQRWDKVRERQLAILERIAAGEDLTGDANIPARTSAGALRNRGLVAVHRHGGSWDAEVTEAGRFYLANGHHPDDPKYQTPKSAGPPGPRKQAVARKQTAARTQAAPRTPTIADQRQAAARALMERLAAERSVTLTLDTDHDLAHWRRVIDFAKRHAMAPGGTRVEKSQPFPGDKLIVELVNGVHPNSASAEPARPPVPVPDQLRSLHPVVAALKADEQRLMMPAPIRHRSLRILQALAAELVKRDHTIRHHPVSDRHRHAGYHYAGTITSLTTRAATAGSTSSSARTPMHSASAKSLPNPPTRRRSPGFSSNCRATGRSTAADGQTANAHGWRTG